MAKVVIHSHDIGDLILSKSGITSAALPSSQRIILNFEIEQASISILPPRHVSPIFHGGGKGKAADTLAALVVVPANGVFLDSNCGGCSVPLAVAQRLFRQGRRAEFFMRDINHLLINFWQCLQADASRLVAEVRQLVEPLWFDKPALFRQLVSILKANKPIISQDTFVVAAAYYAHSLICHPKAQFSLKECGLAKAKSDEFLNGYAGRLGGLYRWSATIRDWNFRVQDFTATMTEAITLGSQAFLFVDPPYEGTATATYALEFPKAKQDELAVLVGQVHAAGAAVMVTLNWSEANIRRYAGHHCWFRTQDYGTKGPLRLGNPGREVVILTYEVPHMAGLRRQFGWKSVDEGRDWVVAKDAELAMRAA